MATSSFHKVSKHSVNIIRGTKPSFQNAQLLTSTGIASLDHYLGGGLPVGTILLVEEEPGGCYADLILKYFLAEGVACKHALFVAGAERDPDSIIKGLPGLLGSEDVADEMDEDLPMPIAWRYKHNNTNKAYSGDSVSRNRFTLGQKMDASLLKECPLVTQSLLSRDIPDCHFPLKTLHSYETLLKKVAAETKSYCTEGKCNNLLRIALSGLGSPLCWSDHPHLAVDPSLALIRCLHTIKTLVRAAYAICLVTIPANVYADFGTLNKIRRFCDFVVGCDPFTNSQDHFNPAFRDYHGLFQVHHRNLINSISPGTLPDSQDLVFSSRKKNFIIEKLHLPPDLTNVYSGSSDLYSTKSSGCGSSSGSSKIDF